MSDKMSAKNILYNKIFEVGEGENYSNVIEAMEEYTSRQTSTLRKELEDCKKEYFKIGYESIQEEVERIKNDYQELKEQNEKMREAIEKQISDYTHDLRESVSTCNKEYFQGALFILNHLKTLTNMWETFIKTRK